MSEYKINFSDYKASGVYYIEVDNTISSATRQAALRLAVGFNGRAPFNRPVYLSSTTDCDEFLGPIDRKLERKGCYTNRAIRTMISKAPVYALNLLPVDTTTATNTNKDVTSVCKLDFMPTTDGPVARKMRYCVMFDRSKFWVADENTMMFNLDKSVAIDSSEGDIVYGNGVHEDNKDNFAGCAFYAIGNCGTSDISLIVRKAENLTGFNVTFLDWYGKEDDIPYGWINPYDYVADYFVQVIAVKGNLTNYANYATDPIWKEYFDNEGLKKDKVNKFLRLDAVTVLGNWVGCIIPDFYDKQGRCRSIDYLINRTANKTGLMFGINATALDTLAYSTDADHGFFMDLDGDRTYKESEDSSSFIDPVGHTIDSSNGFKFLSHADVKFDSSTSATIAAKINRNEFFIYAKEEDAVTSFMPQVGDYVKCADGTFTKITKKRYSVDPSVDPSADSSLGAEDASYGYTFTTLKPVSNLTTTYGAYRVEDDMHIDNVIETEEQGNYQDYMVYSADNSAVDESEWKDGNVQVRKSILDAYSHLAFIVLPGLKLVNRHLPGFGKADADGVTKADIEAGVSKIYEMLKDPGIRKGLLNDEVLDFRYIVDTFGGGLDTNAGAKSILSELAAEKEHCTALINLPSLSDFAKYVAGAPCYYDGDGVNITSFNVKHITTEGNPDMPVTAITPGGFSLPTIEQGCDHAAFFTPYLKYAQGTGFVLIPPAADVSNTFMNKFTGGDPYKTTANLDGIISNVNVKGLEVDLDEDDRGYLEPFGVNPIITYNGINMIFGDRTAYQIVNSDLNYLHVRELLNTINIQARNILHDYVFTHNVATTRKEIYDKLKPMLDAMKDSDALLKYEIQVDEVNNTKEVIDEKFCIVDIGVWVSPNMEKIVTRVTLNRSTTA